MIHRRAYRQGVTIIEIVVALMILTVGAYAVFNHFISQANLSRHSQRRAQAQLLAQQQLEELRACSPEALLAWTPVTSPEILSDDPQFQVLRTLTPQPDGSVAITTRVGWGLDAQNQFVPPRVVTLKGVRLP